MADMSALTIAMTLVPSAVASIAMIVTASQNRWQRNFSDRQQRFAMQQLNLTLLDRRVAALAAVQAVIARYWNASLTDNRNEQLFHILHEAGAIFSRDVAKRLRAAWEEQVVIYNLRVDTLQIVVVTDPRLDALRRDIEIRREALIEDLKSLHTDMERETRIVE